MSQPTAYARLYSFTDWQTVNPTKPLPGSELDAELNSIKASSDQVLTNLALIQRDDGKLGNQTVTAESMSASALALILQGSYNPRGAWAANITYAAGDLAEFNSATYLCLIAHTSTASFATDKLTKWILIANGALSGGASTVELFSGTGSQTVFNLATSYTNVNSAVVFVSGVAQIPTQNFTLSGTVLTFVTAPPAPSVPGQKNVMVRGTGVEAQLAVDAASTQAANALGYANSANASQSAALASQNAASVSQSAALASQNLASTSASTATTQANTATTQATNAASSASTASTQAATATTQATTATTQAGIATTQASNAAASASTASTGATTATTQAGIATTQAGISTTQAGNAATSAANALSSLNTFRGQYYGALASDPTLDPLGAAITAGDLYFNTSVPEMRVYNGAAWVVAYVSGAGFVTKSSVTGSAGIPAGTQAQRDASPSAGNFRFNTDLSKFEGYNGAAWGSVGGGATGGGSDAVFNLNGQTINSNFTIPAGQNASSVGTLTIASGAVVTISAGSTWAII